MPVRLKPRKRCLISEGYKNIEWLSRFNSFIILIGSQTNRFEIINPTDSGRIGI